MQSHAVEVADVVPTFFAQSGLAEYDMSTIVPKGYTLQGDNCHILTLPVPPGGKIQAEPGTMCFASDGMKEKVKIGGFGRFLSGEGLFKAVWENTTNKAGFIGLTPNLPGAVIPIDLDQNGGSFKCKRDAFMAAASADVKITISMLNTESCLACCCSGMDMFMQEIRGNGMVFIQGNGTIMEKVLATNEEIVVDTNSVVGVGGSVSVDIVRTGGCSAMCCSGEGLFNTTLRGPGRIILCSMPLEKLRALFPRPARRQKPETPGGEAGP